MATIRDLIRSGDCNTARCHPNAFLDDVIDMMAQLNESAVTVVTDAGQIVGILTDYDIMRAINCKGTSGHSISGEHVKDWMSQHVSACADSTSYQAAERIMATNGIHHLVVKHDDRLVGTISMSDLLAKIHACDSKELVNIREELSGARTKVAA